MPITDFEQFKVFSAKIPFLLHLGIEVVAAREGWVRMKMTYSDNLVQPFVVHGGALYSLADAAAAHAGMTMVMPENGVTTVEQRINFLRGTKDSDLFCEANVVNLGKTLIYVEASITDQEEKLIARSTATLMRLDMERYKKS